MAPNMDNDEVIYNRQVVSVLTHGGPRGYFGYEETHATSAGTVPGAPS